MSDLQCAATLLLTGSGPPGREAADELGRSLRAVRLALVYTSPLPDAVRTAAVVARATGAEVVVRNGLGELSGTESDAQVRARVSDELEAIGDLHRGETVLVVSHADALRTAVPGEHDWAVGAVVELAMDADGWVVRGGTGATTRPKPIQNA